MNFKYNNSCCFFSFQCSIFQDSLYLKWIIFTWEKKYLSLGIIHLEVQHNHIQYLLKLIKCLLLQRSQSLWLPPGIIMRGGRQRKNRNYSQNFRKSKCLQNRWEPAHCLLLLQGQAHSMDLFNPKTQNSLSFICFLLERFLVLPLQNI